jgi:alkanesulfonate monooxygenase SsuD/methylene tetrahydromethanopterin reductase-like flavin-dependent oxidoreductase (luciferase family)
VKFGLFSQTAAPLGSNHAKLYEDFLDFAVEAERLGFWSLWTTEHHFSPDKTYRPYGASDTEYPVQAEYDLTGDPLTLLAYVAARTFQLRLGTAVLVLPWDHPIRSAERAAMVDVLSGGRLELGIGRGGPSPNVTAVFDVPGDPAAANRKFREEVDIFRKAWTAEPFTHVGEFYQFPELTMLPKPVQPKAPLWVGSASDESAIWAAQQGLPYATIAWPLTIMEGYKHKRKIYNDAADAAQVDVSDNDNACLLYSYCGESDQEAAEMAEYHMRQFMYINEQHYQMFRDPAAAKQLLTSVGFDTLSQWVDDMAVYPIKNHVIGSPKTVVEQLKYHEEELGLTYPLLNVGWGLMPRDKVIASMRRMSEEVMPHFSPATASVG